MEKLLIVDDEAPIRKLLRQFLEIRGYHCTTATDPAEAREFLANQSFDLVISDIYMGKETGIDLAKYVKANFEGMGIIIVSSLSDRDKIKEVLDIGVYGFIVKPIERNNLYINVENAIRRLHLERNEKRRRQNLENQVIVQSAEAAANERRFKNLVEGSIQGILVYRGSQAVFVNQAFLDIFGYSEKEILNLSDLHQILTPEDRDRLIGYQKARLAGKKAPSEYEFQGLRKDGTRIWIDNRVRMVEWDGKPSFQLTITDITQRKQSEALLKKSKANLNTILASVHAGVFVIDAETHLVVDANPYAVDLIGLPKNQIVGKKCFVFSETSKPEKCPVTTSNRDIEQVECTLRCGNGEIIPVLKTVKKTRINDRTMLIESFVDLRELKKAEEAEKEQSHFLSQLIDDIPFPFFVKDTKGAYQILNSAYLEFKGIMAEEIIGKTVFDLYPKEIAEKIYQRNNDIYADQKVHTYFIQLPNSKGEIREMEVTQSIFYKRDGTIGGQIGLMMDMTDKNRMEAQLHQAQKLESIGQLAAGIAHEINTPTQYVGDNTRFLNDAFDDIQSVLKSYSKLLEMVKNDARYQALVEELQEVLEDADLEYLEEEIPVAIGQSLEGVDRVTKIVRSMKEFSHPGMDEKTPINLNNAIQSTITVARNEWKYVAEVTTDFDESLPPIACFPGELNQVFLNIIVNAAHAMEKMTFDKGDKGEIHIATRSNGNFVKIIFRDNGCGIPEEIQNRIFDPFFTTKDVGKGTGQGLSIAHTVITENHNGTITCDSHQGEGTVFTIRLPLTDVPRKETNA